jgi:hypothetical protein
LASSSAQQQAAQSGLWSARQRQEPASAQAQALRQALHRMRSETKVQRLQHRHMRKKYVRTIRRFS